MGNEHHTCFKSDKGVEAKGYPCFAALYAKRWPRLHLARFDDFSDPRQRELQHRGVDTALYTDLAADPVDLAFRRLKGERTCITIDEKFSESSDEIPGLPVERGHVWNGRQKRWGWVNDPKHSPDLIIFACRSTGRGHIFRADDVKANWQRGVDPGRVSNKDNDGLWGDTWTSTALYVPYETFSSWECVQFAPPVDPMVALRKAWRAMR